MGGRSRPKSSLEATPLQKATERAGGMTGRMPGVTRARRLCVRGRKGRRRRVGFADRSEAEPESTRPAKRGTPKELRARKSGQAGGPSEYHPSIFKSSLEFRRISGL